MSAPSNNRPLIITFVDINRTEKCLLQLETMVKAIEKGGERERKRKKERIESAVRE